ncbi:MAG: uncharacterized protein KVP18_003207 [Porospora cf. gigantea A]|nr:MAG: hypothetical protein KVP18_003207 [Porospora cf. gigantea A]
MTGDVYSLSPPGLNARQKKHLKRKQNLKEKKAREKEDAGLWPEDVHKPEREALLSSFQAALAEVPRLGTLPAVEAIALANDTDRRIGTLEKVMMESIAVEEAKNERPPRGETKEALGDRIKALISKRERDEVSLNSLLRVYGVCLCWEGLKQYKSSIAALTAACTELRQGNQSAIDAANRFRAREELLGRVNDLLQAKEMDPIDLEDLISVNVDVTVEGVNLLFVPPNSLQRRISQLYSVIVERPRGRQARGTSLVQVHGEESAVAGVMAFLKKCDWTCGGKASQEVHRRLIGAIVGRGGSGIRAIEEETRCILRMDETHLKIYGEPSNVDAVLKKIDTIRSDNEQAAFVTADVLVPSSIARYIQRYSLSELRDLYSKCQGASIRVVLQGSDNQGHLVVRARVDDCATLEADVKKLIAGLSFVELPATGRAVGRVFGAMSPRRVLAKEIRLTE